MENVKVCRYKVWSQLDGGYVVSSRYATIEAIKSFKGEAIEGTEIEVDKTAVSPEGTTAIDYRP